MLYHGSNHKIEYEIEPRVSFDLKPLVYATDDYRYALLRSGKFDPEKFLIKEDYNGSEYPICLIEIAPNAFKEVFNTAGYIYLVNKDQFEPLRQNEFVSIEPVKIKSRILIENVLEEILNSPDFKLIYYKESLSYWKSIRGNKDGYLKRRADRLESLKSSLYASPNDMGR